MFEGKSARLQTGSSAVIFDEPRVRVLLTRRTDNGRWCLPGEVIDPNESVMETSVRKIFEETGLEVQIVRLIGVYSFPDFIIEYADGNRWQLVAVSFEPEMVGGELRLSNETTDVGYFSVAEMDQMDVMKHHRERIADAMQGRERAYVR